MVFSKLVVIEITGKLYAVISQTFNSIIIEKRKVLCMRYADT